MSSKTRETLFFFVSGSLLPCQNPAFLLPTMQYSHQQFDPGFGCVERHPKPNQAISILRRCRRTNLGVNDHSVSELDLGDAPYPERRFPATASLQSISATSQQHECRVKHQATQQNLRDLFVDLCCLCLCLFLGLYDSIPFILTVILATSRQKLILLHLFL